MLCVYGVHERKGGLCAMRRTSRSRASSPLAPDELVPENHLVRRIESLARPAPPVSLALPPRVGRHGGQAIGPHSSGPRGLAADGPQDGLPNE